VQTDPDGAVVRSNDRVRNVATELDRFEDGTRGVRFRARTAQGRQFLLPEPVADILRLLDGTRTPRQVSAALAGSSRAIGPERIEEVITRDLLPKRLVETVGDAPPVSNDAPATAAPGRTPWDFSLRVPLVSQERLAPVVAPLTSLFRPLTAAVCLAAIVLAHVAFYQLPVAQRAMPSSGRDFLLAFLLAFLTVCFHELGHAAACRRFGCQHDEIGFCLYLIFPALYVNLSRAWQLPRWQRAVIDAGGMYFQLLMVVPLYFACLMTGRSYWAGAIYSIDFAVLFSINPLLRFDGYWLLVDLSGVANLQRRALRLLGDTFAWPVRRRTPQLLASDFRRGPLALVAGYALFLVVAIALLLPQVFLAIPRMSSQLLESLARIPGELIRNPDAAMLHLYRSFVAFAFLFMFVRPLRRLSTLWRGLVHRQGAQ